MTQNRNWDLTGLEADSMIKLDILRKAFLPTITSMDEPGPLKQMNRLKTTELIGRSELLLVTKLHCCAFRQSQMSLRLLCRLLLAFQPS